MAVIAIVTSAPPLVEGGHLVLARSLERALAEAGHEVGLVTTPSNRFGRQGSAYLANWLTDVGVTGDGRPIDQVISLRFPAYAVRHPRHVCWLVHTMREYYDLWPRFAERLSTHGRLKEAVRRTLVRRADRRFLGRVTRLFAISGAVADRVRRWNGLTAEVLHPPAPPRPYRTDEFGDYVFFASRLTPLKRADLVLRALARPEAGGVRCVRAGEGEDRSRLERLIADLKLEARVTLVGQLSEPELVDHLARCAAVVFPPLQEDYGFVAVEAFAAGKPVITCSDSGGTLELVRDGVTGLVVPPEPVAVAAAMAALVGDRAQAERLGSAGRATAERLSWADVARRLVIAQDGP
jgi:glycosyltransferase involved in cell wall biosynthesis